MTRKKITITAIACGLAFAANSAWALSDYTVNTDAAPEAKVFQGYSQDEGPPSGASQDPYGTYHPAFPSLNDNGDVSGRAPFQYADPYSGGIKLQSEASVWVNGTIHRFGVIYCVASSCQSRALVMNNARTAIAGSSHMIAGAFTPYFERNADWFVKDGAWVSYSGPFEVNYQSFVIDMNNNGDKVGSAMIAVDYVRHGQVRIGTVTRIIGSANEQSLGLAINSNGEITGSILDIANNAERAYWWGPGQSTDDPTIIPTLGGGANLGFDINDARVVVGISRDAANDLHAFKWENGVVSDLGTLGGTTSSARSINNAGVIVGFADTVSSGKHAFLYSDGVMSDLNDHVTLAAGWVLVDAYTVNNNGQILVRAQKDGSSAAANNAYWVLSPQGYLQPVGPAMLAGHGPCQWGQVDCDIVYPPTPAVNSTYTMPAGPLPVISASDIPVADVYVCNTGCENYTAYLPMYATIAEAASNAPLDGTVVVMPGLYNESVVLYRASIVGLSRDYTIIDATGTGNRPLFMYLYGSVSNIVLTGGTAIYGGGVYIGGGGTTIDNSIIQGNTASSHGGGIFVKGQNGGVTVTNSTLTRNKAKTGGGFAAFSYSTAKLNHSIISHNEAEHGGGAFFSSYMYFDSEFNGNIVDSNLATKDGGALSIGYGSVYVKNSIISNNHANGSNAGLIGQSGIYSSVIYGNTAGNNYYGVLGTAGGDNNIAWNNGDGKFFYLRNSIVDGYCGGCINIKTTNPLFTDAENGDFRLQENSPAIDTGVDLSPLSSGFRGNFYINLDQDFSGKARGIDGDAQGPSAGNDYDMGAIEFVPSMLQ